MEYTDVNGRRRYTCFSVYDRKLYEIDLSKGESREIPIVYDKEQLKKHEPGFCENSKWLQYVCMENAFNSLRNFLDGKIAGAHFDREKQIEAYGAITANHDGTCGEKIHRFVQGKL